MDSQFIPCGAKHIAVFVTADVAFPPPPDSPEDIALLRAANRALVRQTNGAKDEFLFVFVGECSIARVSDAVAAYGFPRADFIAIPFPPVLTKRIPKPNEGPEKIVDRAIDVVEYIRVFADTLKLVETAITSGCRKRIHRQLPIRVWGLIRPYSGGRVLTMQNNVVRDE